MPGALSLSRVQLALRGLESEEPVVRVAGGFSFLFLLLLFCLLSFVLGRVGFNG